MPCHTEVVLLDPATANHRQAVAWELARYPGPVPLRKLAAGAEVSVRDAARLIGEFYAAGWVLLAAAFDARADLPTGVTCALTNTGREAIAARFGVPPCPPVQVRRGW